MIVVEAQKGGGGIGENLLGRRRPDGAGHRQDMVVAKRCAYHLARDIRRGSGARPRGCGRRASPRGRIARDRKHRPETRTKEIGALTEQAAEAPAGVFHTSAVDRHSERHVGRLARRIEDPQQLDKIGICLRVEDDEPGVDGDISAVDRDKDRIRMTADATRLFIDDDVMALLEKPRRRQPGDPVPMTAIRVRENEVMAIPSPMRRRPPPFRKDLRRLLAFWTAPPGVWRMTRLPPSPRRTTDCFPRAPLAKDSAGLDGRIGRHGFNKKTRNRKSFRSSKYAVAGISRV